MGNNPFDKLRPAEPIWKDFEIDAETLAECQGFVEEQHLPETAWEEPPPAIPQMPEVHWEEPFVAEEDRYARMTIHQAMQTAIERCEVAASQYPAHSEAWKTERGRMHEQRIAEALELEAIQEPLTVKERYSQDCQDNYAYRDQIHSAEDLLTIADTRKYLAARRAFERGFLDPEKLPESPTPPPLERVWGFQEWYGAVGTGFWMLMWLAAVIAGAMSSAGEAVGGFIAGGIASFIGWWVTVVYPCHLFGKGSGGWGITRGQSSGKAV